MNVRSRATIAALVLAIAALALPAAGAARPANRVGIHGIGQTSAIAIDSSDVVSRYMSNRANDTSDVVSRYMSNRANDTSDVLSRFVANVLSSSPAVSAQQTTLASSDRFDWSVPLIGAGGAVAIVLLLSAAGIGAVRHRHSHPKSA